MDKLTPQQEKFLKALLDPKSPTWGNYLQSGLAAGYSQEYSESISYQLPNWLSEFLGDNKLVIKASKNLELALDGALDEQDKAKKIQYQASEFVLKGLQKSKWADRKELTGKDGEKLIDTEPSEKIKELADKLNEVIKNK